MSVLASTELGLSSVDPALARLIEEEFSRQSATICLIPSENYVSCAVLEAMGSVFTNKYSEGYPGRRYYEGQQVVDQLEPLAVDRARRMFGVEHANVQPYSGSPANLAIYLAYLDPGDAVMGMSLPMGGHLTHGWGVSITGKWFRSVPYGVRRETGRVDLDEVRALARKERPKLIFCGGTAIPRTIDFDGFADIAQEVGAILAADIAHVAGLIAGGVHPSPVGHADVISTPRTRHCAVRGARSLCAPRSAHRTLTVPCSLASRAGRTITRRRRSRSRYRKRCGQSSPTTPIRSSRTRRLCRWVSPSAASISSRVVPTTT